MTTGFTPFIVGGGVVGFEQLRNDQDQQIERLKQSPEAARDIAYFKENISSVRSAQELVADRRLLEVALTAYGLESEIDKTAFVQRVLDEGLSEGSLANRLNDPRWSAFVGAFRFGDANAAYEVSAFQAAVELSFRPIAAPEPAIDPIAIDGFRARTTPITTVDELLSEKTTLDVALAAFSLERGDFTDAHFRALIEGGIDDEDDYANVVDDGAWTEFTRAFAGLETGGTMAQVSTLWRDTEIARANLGLSTSSTAEASLDPSLITNDDVAYFEANIGSVSTVDDFLADAQLKKVALFSYGLIDEPVGDADLDAMLEAAMTGDFSLAEAEANSGWQDFAAAVARGLGGETVARMDGAIEIQISKSRIDVPPTAPDTPTIPAEDLEYFKANIGNPPTSDALIADERLLEVALTAFGLENEGRSTGFIKDILDEDPFAEGAFVSFLSDGRWEAFSKAFNPNPDGSVSPALLQFEIEERLIANGAPSEDLDYLRRNFNLIDTNLDFVLDPKLMDITISAFNLEKETFTSNFFLSMILSDPSDQNSFARRFGDDNWLELSQTLGNFAGAGGATGLASFGDTVTDLYATQLFEASVGATDNNLRLALNFVREIGSVAESPAVATAGWFQIMGQEPLRRVIDTAFGLPTEFAQLDLEAQQTTYEARAFSEFGVSDPSFLSDPNNIVTVLTRFLSISSDNGGLEGAPGFAAVQLMTQTANFARGGTF